MPDDLMYRIQSVTTGWGGAPGLNTFYFLVDDVNQPDHVAGANSCLVRVRSFWFGVGPAFPSNWISDSLPAVDILNADNGEIVESLSATPVAPVVGTYSGPFGPQVAMICASLNTPGIIDGRRVRGRAFIGPPRNDDDFDGTPKEADRLAVKNGFDALVAAAAPAPQLVVWSRRRPVSLRHPTGLGGSAHVVGSSTVKDTYAILRSRRQ